MGDTRRAEDNVEQDEHSVCLRYLKILGRRVEKGINLSFCINVTILKSEVDGDCGLGTGELDLGPTLVLPPDRPQSSIP
jgi:hypothetical protein